MAKKNDGQEHVTAYYGINVHSNEVELVWECRNGELVQMGKDGRTQRHAPFRGNRAEMELPAVFHLIEAFGVSSSSLDDESTKKRIEELKVKAAERKARGSQA